MLAVSANSIELMGGVPIRNNLMASAMSTSPGDSGLTLARGEDSCYETSIFISFLDYWQVTLIYLLVTRPPLTILTWPLESR